MNSVRSTEGIPAAQYSPLVLAYIGDAFYEMVVRTMAVEQGNTQVEKLHKTVTRLVRAGAQAAMVNFYEEEGMLTEAELAVYKRGRNAKSHTIPKNADPAEYRRATGFEALMGYLYLNGECARALDLIRKGIEEYERK
ncbi:MAG: ribonuclease III [Lachnospiraceae bacterium]|nr:ribonuclease III [Lachnospiraceae bacterium]